MAAVTSELASMRKSEFSTKAPVVSAALQASINRVNTLTSNYEVYHWTPTVILSSLEMSDIFQIEQDFGRQTELSVNDFAWLLLKSVPHQPEETVYVVAGIVELYKDIQALKQLKSKRNKQVTTTILWKDVTDYIFEEAFPVETGGPTPTTKMVSHSNATGSGDGPLVYGAKEKNSRRIDLSKRYVDKNHHPNAIRDSGLARNIKCVLTLDQMSDTIRMYSYTSKLMRSVVPRKDLHTFDTFMMSFDWSDSEMRIGAVLQDYTMSFWDYSDDFTFEKCFKTVQCIQHLQSRIWYLEFGYWVTSDKTHVLNEWDIYSERCKPWPKRHSEQIVSLLELPRMRLASSALDKTIVLWDMTHITSIMTLLLGDVSAHTLVYCEDFDLLMSAGYEIRASIWRFDSESDCSLAAKLEGHSHTVTALEALKGTPLAVTADDAGYIKTWDLRTFHCLQTLNVDKISVTKILSIPDICSFIAVGFRVYWLEYEMPNNTNANGVNEFIVYTRYAPHSTECRVINAYDGRQVRILADVADVEAECSRAEVTKQGKRLLIADRIGVLRKAIYLSGEILEEAFVHHGEIVDLKYDAETRLIVTVSADRSVKLLSEDNLRPIKSLDRICDSQVTYATSCFELGLVATASEAESVRIWKLAMMEFLGVLGQHIDICAMKFAAPRPILLTADFSGKVYGWNCSSFDSLPCPVFCLDVAEADYANCLEVERIQAVASSAFMTSLQDGQVHLRCYLGTEGGIVQYWDLAAVTDDIPVVKEPPSLAVLLKPCVVNAQRFEKLVHIAESRECRLPESVVTPLRSWRAYKDSVVDLLLADISEKVVVTVSHDASFDIWNSHGKVLCHLNLRENTPLYWNLQINTFSYRAQLYESGLAVLKHLQTHFSMEDPQRQESAADSVPVSNLVDIASKPFRRQTVIKPVQRKIATLRQMEAKKMVLKSMGESQSSDTPASQPPQQRLPSRFSSQASRAQTPTAIRLSPSVHLLAAKLDQRVSLQPSPVLAESPSEKKVIEFVEQSENTSDEVLMGYLNAKKEKVQKANRSFSSGKFRRKQDDFSSPVRLKPIRRLKFMQELDFDLNRSKNTHTSVLHIGIDPVSRPNLRVRRHLLEQIPEKSNTHSNPSWTTSSVSPSKFVQHRSAVELLQRFDSDKKTFSVAANCLMKFYGSGTNSFL